ncbi:unnamed protein product [Caenorhabditis brenneri]
MLLKLCIFSILVVMAVSMVMVSEEKLNVLAPVGQCPGGPSLPIECDPKRPWPQCPPQSYCYATNSVDIGPYFCCPVWSTYGAARSVRVLMGRVH